jgi:hypothetical protein
LISYLVGLRRMLFNERAGFSPESTINIRQAKC